VASVGPQPAIASEPVAATIPAAILSAFLFASFSASADPLDQGAGCEAAARSLDLVDDCEFLDRNRRGIDLRKLAQRHGARQPHDVHTPRLHRKNGGIVHRREAADRVLDLPRAEAEPIDRRVAKQLVDAAAVRDVRRQPAHHAALR
jgi:hypothetical protein